MWNRTTLLSLRTFVHGRYNQKYSSEEGVSSSRMTDLNELPLLSISEIIEESIFVPSTVTVHQIINHNIDEQWRYAITSAFFLTIVYEMFNFKDQAFRKNKSLQNMFLCFLKAI